MTDIICVLIVAVVTPAVAVSLYSFFNSPKRTTVSCSSSLDEDDIQNQLKLRQIEGVFDRAKATGAHATESIESIRAIIDPYNNFIEN